jgi:ABC-2 type transport system ATP-binding protein
MIHDKPSGPAPHAALALSGVAKVFRTSWGRRVLALTRVSLEVRRGEIYGLLGPNGAGKSTTLKILLGFMKPSSGTGSVLDRPLGSVESRRRTGFLPENPYFYDYLTATEFLEACAALSEVPAAGRKARIAGLLERVGLDPGSRLRLRKYSKGMLQRVGLAQAILHDPELLILDEPMSGLDPSGRREVRDLILEQRREGKTVLFSSHVLPDVEALCERVGILVRGELRQSGRVTELIERVHAGFEVEVRDLSGPLRNHWMEAGILRESGDRHIVTASNRDELEERIRQILGARATLFSVKPLQGSLEDVFLAEVGETDPPTVRRTVAGREAA